MDEIWTKEKKAELVRLMSARPRLMTDNRLAKKFNCSRQKLYLVYNETRAEIAMNRETYVDEQGLTVVKYSTAYANGIYPQPSAKGRN